MSGSDQNTQGCFQLPSRFAVLESAFNWCIKSHLNTVSCHLSWTSSWWRICKNFSKQASHVVQLLQRKQCQLSYRVIPQCPQGIGSKISSNMQIPGMFKSLCKRHRKVGDRPHPHRKVGDRPHPQSPLPWIWGLSTHSHSYSLKSLSH